MANQELDAILAALEANGDAPGEIDKARDLSAKYVQAHPDEFADFAAWGTGQDALEQTVRACETFRTSGMREMWARAEAWHFYTWEPQQIGGNVQPTVRNLFQGGTN
jgi:hypothetical protein